MLETKARKQGNSIVIGMPSQLNVVPNRIYFIKKEDNGNILLIPKIDDPYANVMSLPQGAGHEVMDWEDWKPLGRELDG